MGKIYPLFCIPLLEKGFLYIFVILFAYMMFMSMFCFFILQKVLRRTLFVNRAYAVIAVENQFIVDLKLIVDSPASVMN